MHINIPGKYTLHTSAHSQKKCKSQVQLLFAAQTKETLNLFVLLLAFTQLEGIKHPILIHVGPEFFSGLNYITPRPWESFYCQMILVQFAKKLTYNLNLLCFEPSSPSTSSLQPRHGRLTSWEREHRGAIKRHQPKRPDCVRATVAVSNTHTHTQKCCIDCIYRHGNYTAPHHEHAAPGALASVHSHKNAPLVPFNK